MPHKPTHETRITYNAFTLVVDFVRVDEMLMTFARGKPRMNNDDDKNGPNNNKIFIHSR